MFDLKTLDTDQWCRVMKAAGMTKVVLTVKPITLRTIPKQVEGRPFADKRTFQFECDDYNEYFMSQLFELLNEVWQTGGCCSQSGLQKKR